LKYIVIRHLNRNYYYFHDNLYSKIYGVPVKPSYFLKNLSLVFNLKIEEVIMIVSDWVHSRFNLDLDKFWARMAELNSNYFSNYEPYARHEFILGTDVATEHTPRMTMLARYGSNVINEDYYQVIRIGG